MKIILIAFGCKVNISEKELLSSLALDYGYATTDSFAEADIAIINSCGVTSHAVDKGVAYIRKLRKNFPKLKIVLTGCLADIADIDSSSIDLLVPNSLKGNVFERLNDIDIKAKPFFGAGLSSTSKTRSFFKIQDGCNSFCTYCIIPSLRGAPISMPIDEAISGFEKCIQAGFKEIVLVGIHIGLYGMDRGYTLFDLLKRLVKVEGNYRIRLSSIEVNEISDGFIDLMAENPERIASHLHIPLQSGSDKVLKLMGRRYSVSDFNQTVEKARKRISNLAIGSDVIVGFPNEDEVDFNDCFKVVSDNALEFLHVFPYSKRNGTPAAIMDGQLADDVKQERSKILRQLGDKLHTDALEGLIGTSQRILSEKGDKGHADNYFQFKLPKGTKVNEFVKIIV